MSARAQVLSVVLLAVACGTEAGTSTNREKPAEQAPSAKREQAPQQPGAATPTAATPAQTPAAPTPAAPTPAPTPVAPTPAAPTPATDAPAVPEPVGELTVEAAAEYIRKWATDNPDAHGLPQSLFRANAPITLAIQVDACDGSAKECLSREDLRDRAAFEAWLRDRVDTDPGGLGVSSKINSCKDACCTFANLGREATNEDWMVPHGMYELRSVCFEVDGQTVLGVRRLKFVLW